MAHKFNPTEFASKQQAKADHEANKQATPNPSSVPQLVARVQLLEQALVL